MDFHERYELTDYKQYLLNDAEKDFRHKTHEDGHHWIGLKEGAKLTYKKINSHGTSKVVMAGVTSLDAAYRIGVAGLLAEALSVQRRSNPECDIDTDRVYYLARRIYTAFKDQQIVEDDENELAIEPLVPMTCDFPSTMYGQITLTDLARPIKEGLSSVRLSEALEDVAIIFNDQSNWEDFKNCPQPEMTGD